MPVPVHSRGSRVDAWRCVLPACRNAVHDRTVVASGKVLHVNIRTSALVAGAVTATLVLSACGSGSSGDNTSKDNGQKGAGGFNAALTGVVNPSDKKGGTLKVTNHDNPDS